MNQLKSFCVKIVILTMLFGVSNSANAEWYSNGTLHAATVGEWKVASYRNKLATAADWSSYSSQAKKSVSASGNMSALRPYAIELMVCVNEAVAGEGYESMQASEIAASCIVLMGWQ